MFNKLIAFLMSIVTLLASFFGGLWSNNATFYNDIAYGTHERQNIDLCLPQKSDGTVGLLLYIHGGAWIVGDNSSYEDNIEDICNDYGYAAAALNYRYLSEDTSIYDILDDIDSALSKIKEIAAENEINIDKVVLEGTSAGAHLAMLYAYSRKETAPIEPVAVISNCGPTDLTDDNYYYNTDLDKESDLAAALNISIDELFSMACGKTFTYETRKEATEDLLKVSPIYYVDKNTVPTIINHGIQDTVVPFSNARSIVEKFEECGVTYEFNIYPNSNHPLNNDADSEKKADILFDKYLRTYLGEEK